MALGLRQRLAKAGDRFAKRLVWSFDKYYGRASKVGDHAFFDADDFPWMASIEADWRKVRAELDTLLPYAAHLPNFQDLSEDQRYVTQDDGWKTYFFYAYGLKAWRNCRRCPENGSVAPAYPRHEDRFLFDLYAPQALAAASRPL